MFAVGHNTVCAPAQAAAAVPLLLSSHCQHVAAAALKAILTVPVLMRLWMLLAAEYLSSTCKQGGHGKCNGYNTHCRLL
jgi:hypothetical protein